MPTDVQLVLPPEVLPPDSDDATGLVRRAAKKARLAPADIAEARVLRVSFDARRRERNWRVSVRLFAHGEEIPPRVADEPRAIAPPAPGAPRALVVGAGPCGLFGALEFLRRGWHVTVLERGRDVRTRRRPLRAIQRGEGIDPDSNYCFGEGGAGTYSDGKLYTRSGSKKDVRRVLASLVEHEHNGLIVDPADIDAWTDALRRVASSPVARDRWAENGRAIAQERLSWQAVASRFEEVFLLAAAHASARRNRTDKNSEADGAASLQG